MDVINPSIRSPGEIVAGRYRLLERLAMGGIGEIWVAEHLHLKQEFALKFLKEELLASPAAAGDILERFRFESQVSAMLGSKTRHIVSVHDAGDSEAGPFLAMEFVSGCSLADELNASGPMPPARLAIILDQVADALAAAHAAGIVHRDIKPANILLRDEPDGSIFVKLADFGIAKATNLELPLDRPKDTTAMTLVGTPDFMSPEQVRGDNVQPATDIWALGVTCYKLLTGALPFQSQSRIARLSKILLDPFPPPSSRCLGLTAAIDAWFSRALAKDPEDRFRSVKEMSAAFTRAIDGREDSELAITLPRARRAGAASSPDLEGSRRAPMHSGAELTLFASERPATGHGARLETSRSFARSRGFMAAIATAAVLATGLVVLHAPTDSASQTAFANQPSPSIRPESTSPQWPIPRATGESAVPAAPDAVPGAITPLPGDAPRRPQSRVKPAGGPVAPPVSTNMPPPTVEPAPAAKPIPPQPPPTWDPSDTL